MTDYAHPDLEREVAAVGGRYLFTKEVRLPFMGREILYHVGCAVADTSCCGVGGAVFARVAGFVESWQYRQTAGGRPVSRVTPIESPRVKSELARRIKDEEMVHQVSFVDQGGEAVQE